jgi:thermitase
VIRLRLVLAGLLALIMVFSLPGPPVAAQPADNGQAQAPNRILVKFLPGTSDTIKASIHSRHGGRVAGVIPDIDVQVVNVSANQVTAMVKAYKGESRVLYAEPDYIAKAIDTPNDPYFANQWGMTKIQAPAAWDITQGSSTVKIAICDTGIDQNHEDLASKIVANQNCTDPWSGGSWTVDDRYGHGTHVAGIAAAITNNGKGVAGVGFNSSLMNVKVLNDYGSGYYSWIVNGITWAADNGAKVINLSLGGYSSSSTLEQAVDYAWDKGCVIVAAAGNDNTSTPCYPAYYTNCIAVAATDQNDARVSPSPPAYYWGSNYGDWVDIAAPGLNIFSTMPNHSNTLQRYYRYKLNYDYLSGTSMASPFVAGVAALLFAKYPLWSNSDVRARIQASVDPTTGFTTTIGRVNAYKAVSSGDALPTVSIANPANGATVSGNVLIQASASDDKGVSKVDFFIDAALLATDSTAPYECSWNTATVADGSHTIAARATDTIGQESTDSITVSVDNVDEPPAVSITSPPNGATVSGTISITASASDDKGVSQVEFYIDAALLATDSTAPYGCSWNTATVSDGSHAIKAVATDTAAQTAQNTVTVTADNTDEPPQVSITSPPNGVLVSGTISITASASDDKGVSKVDFFIDAALLATDNSAPYGCSWNTATASDGSHTIAARATDTKSQTAQNTVTVTVDNTKPVVTIVVPAEGATVLGIITIQASVTEANIDKVEYRVDGGSLTAMSYNAPYWEAGWDSNAVSSGAHTVTVQATDKVGKLGSDTNNFTVNKQAQIMHVASLKMNLVQLAGGLVTYATATATVVDAAGNPVGGAKFFGHWEGATTDVDYGVTNVSGQVTLLSNMVRNPTSGTTFTFVIDSVTRDGYAYDSSANGDFNEDGTAGDIANSTTVP